MTAKLPFQIEIPRRNSNCAAGQEELLPGADYFSLISHEENGNLLRHDYCSVCWDKAKNDLVANAKTYWKSKVEKKKAEKEKNLNRDEKALSLLKQAIERNSTEDVAEAFVLSLYLTRRKQIAFRQVMTHDNGATVSLYEVIATEEMLCVQAVSLSNIQTDIIQQRLAEKLLGK